MAESDPFTRWRGHKVIAGDVDGGGAVAKVS